LSKAQPYLRPEYVNCHVHLLKIIIAPVNHWFINARRRYLVPTDDNAAKRPAPSSPKRQQRPQSSTSRRSSAPSGTGSRLTRSAAQQSVAATSRVLQELSDGDQSPERHPVPRQERRGRHSNISNGTGQGNSRSHHISSPHLQQNTSPDVMMPTPPESTIPSRPSSRQEDYYTPHLLTRGLPPYSPQPSPPMFPNDFQPTASASVIPSGQAAVDEGLPVQLPKHDMFEINYKLPELKNTTSSPQMDILYLQRLQPKLPSLSATVGPLGNSNNFSPVAMVGDKENLTPDFLQTGAGMKKMPSIKYLLGALN
jgi:hypothetical protein